MFDAARENDSLHFEGLLDAASPYAWMRKGLMQSRKGAPAAEVELSILAAWASSHGIAEMLGFRQFDSLKKQLGGEEAFLKAVLVHMGKHVQLL